jgi:hypothetical protein
VEVLGLICSEPNNSSAHTGQGLRFLDVEIAGIFRVLRRSFAVRFGNGGEGELELAK